MSSQTAPNLYTIGEVAAMLGVSPHTIRAWERRHGLVHPARTPSRQRRYRGEDVELLRNVKRAMDLKGVSLRVAYQAATGAVKPEEPSSRRRRLEASSYLELPEEASLWHAVSDVLPELILIVDANGKIVDSNVAVARTFGGVRQRFAGRDFVELVDSNDRAKAALLFGPVPRAVSSWELNMTTGHGPRMYSFRTWQVRQAGRPLLAVVGSEMFREGPGDHSTSELSLVNGSITPHPRSNPTARVLDRLVDRLPFGVAVTTVGPKPRIVYSNRRMIATLGLHVRRLTGHSLDEVLPSHALSETVREVVRTRAPRRLEGLRLPRDGKVLDVALRPLLSSHRKVTSVLLVVEDVTSDGLPDERIERLIMDDRLRNAATANELIGAALDDLGELSPGSEFAIQLFRLQTSSASGSVMGSARSWRLGRDRAAKKAVTRVLDRVAATLAEVSVTVRFGGQRYRLAAAPVFAESERGRRVHIGTVAWRRRYDDPLPAEEKHAVDMFLAHFGLAAQLLRLRSVASRSTAFLDSATAAAAIVRESREVGRGLAERFLERLAVAVHADAALLARSEKDDLVVEAVYSPGREHPVAGQRFRLGDRFVAQSIKTAEPTATANFSGATGVSRGIQRALSVMHHALSVPLVLDGTVVGAIVLLRRAASPFSDEDVALVQTLSSVAMLAIGLKTWRSQRPWPTSATSSRASSRRQQSKTRPEDDRAQ